MSHPQGFAEDPDLGRVRDNEAVTGDRLPLTPEEEVEGKEEDVSPELRGEPLVDREKFMLRDDREPSDDTGAVD